MRKSVCSRGFYPAFGLAAALAEFVGDVALLIGIGYRTACLLLLFTMIVATATQIGGTPWFQFLWPASMVFILAGFLWGRSISVQKKLAESVLVCEVEVAIFRAASLRHSRRYRMPHRDQRGPRFHS